MATAANTSWYIEGQFDRLHETKKKRRHSLPLVTRKHLLYSDQKHSLNQKQEINGGLVLRVKETGFDTFTFLNEKFENNDSYSKTFNFIVQEYENKGPNYIKLPPLRVKIRNGPLKPKKKMCNKSSEALLKHTTTKRLLSSSTDTTPRQTVNKPAIFIKHKTFISSNLPDGVRYVKERSKIILQANSHATQRKNNRNIIMNRKENLTLSRNRTMMLPTLDVKLKEEADILATNAVRPPQKICWSHRQRHSPRKSTFNVITQDNFENKSLVTDLVRSMPSGQVNSSRDVQRSGGEFMTFKPDKLKQAVPIAQTINIQEILVSPKDKRNEETRRSKSANSKMPLKKSCNQNNPVMNKQTNGSATPGRVNQVTVGDNINPCCSLTHDKRLAALYPQSKKYPANKPRKPFGTKIARMKGHLWPSHPKNIILRFENRTSIVAQSKSLRYYAAKRHLGGKSQNFDNLTKQNRDKLTMTGIYLSGQQTNDGRRPSYFKELSRGATFERNKTSGSTFSYVPTNPPPSAASNIDVDLTHKNRSDIFRAVQEDSDEENEEDTQTSSVNKDCLTDKTHTILIEQPESSSESSSDEELPISIALKTKSENDIGQLHFQSSYSNDNDEQCTSSESNNGKMLNVTPSKFLKSYSASNLLDTASVVHNTQSNYLRPGSPEFCKSSSDASSELSFPVPILQSVESSHSPIQITVDEIESKQEDDLNRHFNSMSLSVSSDMIFGNTH